MRRPGQEEKRPLGGALRRAWVGYQRLLDEELATAGFSGRHFPDGRVLHLCARSTDVTVSQIGRQIGMTRQGASKIVRALQDHGFVTLRSSPVDGREKIVVLTTRAKSFIDAQQTAARRIERRLAAQIGSEAFDGLYRLLDALGGDEQPRLRDFLRSKSRGAHRELNGEP